jgi:transcriptional regulator of NAD metabolism
MTLVNIEPVAGEIQGSLQTGLEQSVHGFVRTLNLAGAPLHRLLDCFVVNVFH